MNPFSPISAIAYVNVQQLPLPETIFSFSSHGFSLIYHNMAPLPLCSSAILEIFSPLPPQLPFAQFLRNYATAQINTGKK